MGTDALALAPWCYWRGLVKCWRPDRARRESTCVEALRGHGVGAKVLPIHPVAQGTNHLGVDDPVCVGWICHREIANQFLGEGPVLNEDHMEEHVCLCDVAPLARTWEKLIPSERLVTARLHVRAPRRPPARPRTVRARARAPGPTASRGARGPASRCRRSSG